ncbi:hypothetical protein [Rhizobacter sp. SG703]|uniref:hypothetical protein n=1 Tax=Rhizobacter sp. SG703 TaxID=2587140 RepID=UPI0014476739|nr:hypothetical protein [Rhizobacter sp. SG703]NKI95508.1 hypothetical protein [Rhizobacter sp. SG703]
MFESKKKTNCDAPCRFVASVPRNRTGLDAVLLRLNRVLAATRPRRRRRMLR